MGEPPLLPQLPTIYMSQNLNWSRTKTAANKKNLGKFTLSVFFSSGNQQTFMWAKIKSFGQNWLKTKLKEKNVDLIGTF